MDQSVEVSGRSGSNESSFRDKGSQTASDFELVDHWQAEARSEGSLNPSQHYVDLFYSQLAHSYFESLYLASVGKSLRDVYSLRSVPFLNQEKSNNFKENSISPDFDSLYYLSKNRLDGALSVYSDKFRDYGPQTRLTESVFFRDGLNQVLLGQVYDSSVEIPERCNITTEFSLIGDYEEANKTFSYPDEKKYSINPWERYHVSILVRAIFVFVFFDVSKELYIILISLYFLYIRGFFDGIQELFEKISSSRPMEATLADLRRRRAEIELEATKLLEAETPEVVGPVSETDQGGAETNEMGTEDANGETEAETKAECVEGTGPVETSRQTNESVNAENGVSNVMNTETIIDGNSDDTNNPESLEETEVLRNNPSGTGLSSVSPEKERCDLGEKTSDDKKINYYFCILYQTVGMYLLTLMPWWNPDPTYLI